jgi:hypothetical protein
MVTGENWTKERFGEGWGRQCFGRLENMRSPAALECRDKSSHSSGRHTCLESTLFRDITITAPSCSAPCAFAASVALAPGVLLCFLLIRQGVRPEQLPLYHRHCC